MMARNVVDISEYHFRREDDLFVDTNVWLFVYGPQKPRNSKVEIYSKAFANILAARCRIHIHMLIVSEFINTYARLKWRFMGEPYANFKQFRNSPAFKEIAQDIASVARRVLKHCECLECDFSKLELAMMIDEYAMGTFDFNDQMIAAVCKKRGWMLLTDDGDLSAHGIPLVTANKRLLS